MQEGGETPPLRHAMAKLLIEERNLIPIFHLPFKDGIFDSSEYKRKKNLVIFFLTGPDAAFLGKLDEACASFRQENGQVCVICPLPMDNILEMHKQNRLGFPILSDEDMHVFSKFVHRKNDEKVAALYITDKFGEVFFRYLADDNSRLPEFSDIARSLAFIESQCPECGGGGLA